MRDDARYLFLVVSAALFVACLFPATFVCAFHSPPHRSWLGFQTLLYGPAGLISFDPRWFANISLLLLWRWLAFPAKNRGFPLKAFSTAALSALLAPVIPCPVGCVDHLGAYASLALSRGGWLWVSALGSACLGCLIVPVNAWHAGANSASRGTSSSTHGQIGRLG